MTAFVYAFETDHGYIKIGISKNTTKRLQWLQFALPFEVRCVKTWEVEHAMHVERVAHHSLVDFRARGEWFRAPINQGLDAVENAIRAVAAGARSKPLEQTRGHGGGSKPKWTDEQVKDAAPMAALTV